MCGEGRQDGFAELLATRFWASQCVWINREDGAAELVGVR
jgi:hypothetical protein